MHCFTVSFEATDSISFYINDVSIPPKRLVTLEVHAKSNKALSAATFDFYYDKNILEYRSVKVNDKDSKVKANDTVDKIKAVYLNTYGKNITSDSVIFTITFKTLKEGNTNISLVVSDCVDSNVKSISVGSCAGASITVSKNSSQNNLSSSNTNNDKNNTNNSKDKESNSSADKINKETQAETYNSEGINDFGEVNPLSEDTITFFLMGTLTGILLMFIFLFLNYRARRDAEKEKNNENEDES